MNKQTISHATAATVVTLSIAADRAETTLRGVTVQWVNYELDALAASGCARDTSGAKAARIRVRDALVAACLAQAQKPAREGGLGRKAKGLEKAKADIVIGTVLGESRVATWRAYLSGVARAYASGAAWTTQSHHTAEKATSASPADGAKTPTEIGETTCAVEADRKARTVTFRAGAKSAINADDVQKIVAAVTTDPGRMALTLAYIKAQGWTE